MYLCKNVSVFNLDVKTGLRLALGSNAKKKKTTSFNRPFFVELAFFLSLHTGTCMYTTFVTLLEFASLSIFF